MRKRQGTSISARYCLQVRTLFHHVRRDSPFGDLILIPISFPNKHIVQMSALVPPISVLCVNCKHNLVPSSLVPEIYRKLSFHKYFQLQKIGKLCSVPFRFCNPSPFHMETPQLLSDSLPIDSYGLLTRNQFLETTTSVCLKTEPIDVPHSHSDSTDPKLQQDTLSIVPSSFCSIF